MASTFTTLAVALPIGLIGGLVGGLGASYIQGSDTGSSELGALKAELSRQNNKIDSLSLGGADVTEVAIAGKQIRDYLTANPDFVFMDLLDDFQANETKYSQQRFVKKLDENNGLLRNALYNDATDVVMGNPDGSTVLVEFFDYNCGYCKRAAPELFAEVERDKDIKLVLKELPILSPSSRTAAQAALASAMQGRYEEYHRALISYQGRITDETVFQIADELGLDLAKLRQDMQSQKVRDKIRQTAELAQSLGINGTPAFTVGNELMPGAVPVTTLRRSIAATREAG